MQGGSSQAGCMRIAVLDATSVFGRQPAKTTIEGVDQRLAATEIGAEQVMPPPFVSARRDPVFNVGLWAT